MDKWNQKKTKCKNLKKRYSLKTKTVKECCIVRVSYIGTAAGLKTQRSSLVHRKRVKTAVTS